MLLCPVDHFATIKADPDESVGAYLLGEIDEHSSSRIRMQLMEGKLPLINSGGDPKLPIFLYDPDLMDSSMTQGLFCGPLLLVVSMFPHGVECHQPWLFRFTIIFLFRLLLQLVQRHHQREGMQRFTAWLRWSPQWSVMPLSRFVLTHWALCCISPESFFRCMSHSAPLRNGKKHGKISTLNTSTSSSASN